MNYTSPVASKYSNVWGRYPSGGVHNALDYPVPLGTPVWAAGSAVVKVAGWSTTGFGNHVRLLLDDGNTVIYGHLASVSVRVGQRVTSGTVLAQSGNSGNSTGPHLHMEVRRVSLDPATSWNFTSKLVAYGAPAKAPAKAPVSAATPSFDSSQLVYKANNAEVKKFQAWLWSKHNAGYRDNFSKTVYNFTTRGYTTVYGDATARMVQDMYRYLNRAYPNAGWGQGWVNGVPPRTPGPGLFKQFGAKTY